MSLDDDFNAIVDGLDLEDPEGQVESVQDLDIAVLLERFSRVKQRILRSGQVDATTPEGRDLHSELAAYKVELARRHLG